MSIDTLFTLSRHGISLPAGAHANPVAGIMAADVAPVFSWQAWAGFLALVAFVLALDLGILRSIPRLVFKCGNAARAGGDTAHKLGFGEALRWSLFQVALAAAFCGVLLKWCGTEMAGTFAAGYLMEMALSVDNLFVFLIVFSAFAIPEAQQHRVLFWGISGALVMRAGFILGGVSLLEHFSWLMLVFGGFLIASAVKLLIPKREKEELHLEKNLFVRLARRLFPVTPGLHGNRFFIRDHHGKLAATPLFPALLVIEGSDVIFAVDSIPAVMGVIPQGMPYDAKLFAAFTSNIFAILGLRSLFFVLSGFLQRFWLLKYGLALILAFIGAKMCVAEIWGIHLSPTVSLGILAGTLALTITLSLAISPQKSAAK
ncbi:MAG: TerC/Alx family metal homeostasis membrane protein [Puniceicoccales bacterium]|jgi:tellurite resistance protein TerC|nr:TerC/Alx family metal homeostasis membrane protein [Puniceicoccales bacterium]